MKKDSLFIQRILPAIFLLIGLLFLILGGYFLQNNFNWSKYLFIGISIIIFIVLLYEFFNSFSLNFLWIILFIIINISSYIITIILNRIDNPILNFYDLFLGNNETSLNFFVKDAFLNILVYINALITSILFLTIRFFTVENVDKKLVLNKAILIFVTIIFISISIKLLPILLQKDPIIILLIFGLPIISDTSGFFIGRAFGQRFIKQKLAPTISPKKTWEGALGGFIFGAIFVIFVLFLPNSSLSILNWSKSTEYAKISIILTLPISAIIGDLYFSLIKRLNNVKDYSRILLSHGGFLDRFDSIIFVIFFTLMYIL